MRELTVLIPFLVLRSIVPVLLMPELYMEVGCLRTWGLELPTPNPSTKNTPKACLTRNPAISPARHRGFIKVLNRRAIEFDNRAKNWQGPPGLAF